MKLSPSAENTGDILFNVGELRLVQAHRRGYLTTFVSPIGELVEFAATTIELAVVNLVYRGIISCEVGLGEKKILFIRLADTTDFLSPGKAVEVAKLGYLEKRILGAITKSPGRPLVDYIHELIQQMLPDARHADPGKTICHHIIRENNFNYWDYKITERWPWDKLEFTIDPAREAEMVTELNKISLPIIQQRQRTLDLRDFSARVFQACHELLRTKIPSPE
jgi:hypothetical protein